MLLSCKQRIQSCGGCGDNFSGCTKLKDLLSRPFAKNGYGVSERERRKTIEENLLLPRFSTKGSPEPQERTERAFLSFLFYLARPISLYRLCARYIARLCLFLPSALKRGHPWHRALFSLREGGVHQFERQFVRS